MGQKTQWLEDLWRNRRKAFKGTEL